MITIDSIKFIDEFNPNGTDFLMGVVGDLVTAKIDFHINWQTTNRPMVVSPSGLITRSSCTDGGGSFISDGFNIDDIVYVDNVGVGFNGTYSITNLSDFNMTVGTTFSGTASVNSASIYGVTPIQVIDFYYNLVGQNDQQTFNSLTDPNSVQRFVGSGTNSFTLNPVGKSKTWTIGTVGTVSCVPVVTNIGTTNRIQYFHLEFPFLITPLYLVNQVGNLTNLSNLSNLSINPSYFTNECLKFIYQISARPSLISTRDIQTVMPATKDGNTAWFNEPFPTGYVVNNNFYSEPLFDLVNLKYYDSNNVIIPSLQLGTTNSCHVIIRNNIGLTASNNQYVLNFMWLPSDPTTYQNKSNTNMRNQLYHDRVKSLIGNTATNGDKGIITNVVSGLEFGSNVKMGITFSINMNVTTNTDYMIWVTPQTNGITQSSYSDRSSVVCDVNKASINLDKPTLLTIDRVYFYNDLTITTQSSTFSYYIGTPGDYGLMECDFKIKNGYTINDVNVITMVEVYDISNNVVGSFPLEQWKNNTSKYYDGKVTQINLSTFNNYNIDNKDIRQYRSIARDKVNDTGNYSAFNMSYGFQVGYKWWENLSQYDVLFNNYHTNYWPAYTQNATEGTTQSILPVGYTSKIKNIIEFNIRNNTNGYITQFERVSDFQAIDSTYNGLTNSVTIITNDEYGNDLGGLIATDTVTYVTAIFSGNLALPLGATSAVGELMLYYNNGNNIYDKINTLDIKPETDYSVWVGKLNMTTMIDYSQVIIQGVVDLTGSQVKSTKLYTKLTYIK